MRRFAGLLVLAVGGCASGTMSSGASTGPDGSASHVWLLRNALARGDAEGARNRLRGKGNGAGDALLRELERGIVAHYTGDPAAATDAFDRAHWLNDARETRSLSAGAAAIVTNDMALPYRPSATERAMMYYYGALAWTDRGRPDEAVVEARRLSALLAELDDRKQPLAPDLSAALHDVAAAVYASAGEWQHADVALRLRDRSYDRAPAGRPMPDSSSQMPDARRQMPECTDCGELVLFVERGFVTHRVARSMGVAVADGDVAVVAKLDGDESGLGSALLALDRATTPRYCDWNANAICGYGRRGTATGDVTLINVAWPELRAPRRAEGALNVQVGDSTIVVGEFGGDVSASVAADFGRDAPARLARAAARVVTRQVLFKAGEEALEKADDSKKHKTAWRVAGLAAFGVGGVSTVSERADTRSWALLPDRLIVRRLRVPAGSYTLHRDVSGRSTATVEVRAGATSVAAVRDWGVAAPVIATHHLGGTR